MNERATGPKDASGSHRPSAAAPSHLVIGRIFALRGLAGELKVEIFTDFPERFKGLKRVFLGEELTPYEVISSRLVKNVALLRLKGVDSPAAAAKLIGKLLYVPLEEAVTLPADQYFWHDIIGLKAVTRDGQVLGEVVDILRTGANDVYVVQSPEGKEILIPAIAQVVVEVDPDRGVIVVEPLPGMLE